MSNIANNQAPKTVLGQLSLLTMALGATYYLYPMSQQGFEPASIGTAITAILSLVAFFGFLGAIDHQVDRKRRQRKLMSHSKNQS